MPSNVNQSVPFIRERGDRGMAWGDVGAIFAVLAVGSFMAGFVDAWLEQRKWGIK